jgi:hypothetical protein
MIFLGRLKELYFLVNNYVVPNVCAKVVSGFSGEFLILLAS